jgi:hypothetical protein
MRLRELLVIEWPYMDPWTAVREGQLPGKPVNAVSEQGAVGTDRQ